MTKRENEDSGDLESNKKPNLKIYEVQEEQKQKQEFSEKLSLTGIPGDGNCAVRAIKIITDSDLFVADLRVEMVDSVVKFMHLKDMIKKGSSIEDITHKLSEIFSFKIFKLLAERYGIECNSPSWESFVETENAQAQFIEKFEPVNLFSSIEVKKNHFLGDEIREAREADISTKDKEVILNEYYLRLNSEEFSPEVYKEHATKDGVWLCDSEINCYLVTLGYVLTNTEYKLGSNETYFEYTNVLTNKKIYLHNSASTHWSPASESDSDTITNNEEDNSYKEEIVDMLGSLFEQSDEE